MKASLNWLKDYIDTAETSSDIAHKLTMCGLEVQGISTEGADEVIEVEITSNRPDWLSHVGIARELGAVLGKTFTVPEIRIEQKRNKTDAFHVRIKDTDLCPFYSAVLLEGVEEAPTPQFIKERLIAIGLRPINLPVDITNYVLHEYGQPLHAFDFDKIGNEIIVRRAHDKEKFHAINDKTYNLHTDDLVISDENGAIALAGVMGGIQSEVSGSTKNILLESAFFTPAGIRKTSREHLLMSDSSYRFERRVDPASVITASDRFIQLLLEYTTVRAVSLMVSRGDIPQGETTFSLPFAYVNEVLGCTIESQTIMDILKSLGVVITKHDKKEALVAVPSFRADLERPIDLVEEIARIYGYDNIPATYPRVTMERTHGDRVVQFEETLRSKCIGLGLTEAITFSLVNPKLYEKHCPALLEKAVAIINPSNKELTILRPSFIGNVLDVVRVNSSHGNHDIRVFEIGRVYRKNDSGDLPREDKTLCVCMTGQVNTNWLDPTRACDYFDIKGVCDSLLQSLRILGAVYNPVHIPFFTYAFEIVVNDIIVGIVGKCIPALSEYAETKQEVFYAEFFLECLWENMLHEKRYHPVSKYPSSYRDIALVVKKDILVKDILMQMYACDQQLIKQITLFDQYSGKQVEKGCRSLAFSIEYQSEEKTLASEEIDSTHQKIINALSNTFGATLRT